MRIALEAHVADRPSRHVLDGPGSRTIVVAVAAAVLLLAGFFLALKLAAPAGAPIRSPEPGATVLAAGQAAPR